MIRCSVLGPAGLHRPDGEVPPALLWRKNLGLLVYLARSPNRTRSREHLIGIFWGEKPDERAHHSLSEALRTLRSALGRKALGGPPGLVRLDAACLSLDADDFASAVAEGDILRAASLVRGEFMEGFAVPDAWDFEEWLAAEQREWRHRCTVALVQAAGLRLDAGEAMAAADFADRALRMEPTLESAWRATMLARAIAGNRAGALEAWDECVRVIDDRIGTEPDDETRRLAERIRCERQWSRALPQLPAGGESRRAPLIGRERALADALRVLDRSAAGTAAVLLVTGDPGSGRSRFAEEITARARLRGATVVAVRAVEADVGLAGATLEAQLDALAMPTGTSAAERLREAALDRPLLLVLDDAHYADSDSLQAIAALARTLAAVPLCFLLTCTPYPHRAELDEIAARVGRDLSGAHIPLEPLDDHALARLARWALPSYDDDDVDRIVRRLAVDSAGLPLLAIEILHAVALGLEIEGAPRVWPEAQRTLRHTLPAPLPDTVTAALRVGFRRLSPDARRLLTALAVLGERAAAPVVAAAAGVADEAAWAAYEELEWTRWIVADPRGYSFTARIARDVVLRDLTTGAERERILTRMRSP
jgi:DNA-binding SARP family transcriptional activator